MRPAATTAAFLTPAPLTPAARPASPPRQRQAPQRKDSPPASPSAPVRPAPRACAAAPPPKARPVLSVCRVCKQRFDPAENHARACRFHPCAYSGRLLRVTPTETSGLEYFYDCCGATDVNATGCTHGYHVPYDE